MNVAVSDVLLSNDTLTVPAQTQPGPNMGLCLYTQLLLGTYKLTGFDSM